jgi:hypothetical protein
MGVRILDLITSINGCSNIFSSLCLAQAIGPPFLCTSISSSELCSWKFFFADFVLDFFQEKQGCLNLQGFRLDSLSSILSVDISIYNVWIIFISDGIILSDSMDILSSLLFYQWLNLSSIYGYVIFEYSIFYLISMPAFCLWIFCSSCSSFSYLM